LDDTVTVGESWQYDVSSVFSDPDGDALVYSFSGLPSWVAVNGSTLSGVPDSGDVAQVSITVTAADPFGEFVEDSFTLTVEMSNVNSAPELVGSGLLDDTVTVGESWQYDVSSVFSDPDGDALV
ncbi:putative Ig domain-containing protein, partial [Puniceicoccaceae bacterium K14]|nr:putative Ig domain-containing protein [Puniceicoccaceae bacterium K14]